MKKCILLLVTGFMLMSFDFSDKDIGGVTTYEIDYLLYQSIIK
jgi:hypothetical protein